MACPYLKDGRAQYCHAAPVRKLVLSGPRDSGAGRCASPRYQDCEWAGNQATSHDCCPFLEQIQVQYCTASPITKLVPCSDSQLSSCASSSYRYCDSYLSLARPRTVTPLAPFLFHSPNHFWLDAQESGFCHIGIDSFLVNVVGSVEALTFATLRGTVCPAIVLTIHGVEWPMSFPNPVMIHTVNGRVRSDPARLGADPFGAGWLFEGWELPNRTRSGLITGPQAETWQADERDRLRREIQQLRGAACDGGEPVRGVAGLLPRAQLVRLLQHFFARRDWAVED